MQKKRHLAEDLGSECRILVALRILVTLFPYCKLAFVRSMLYERSVYLLNAQLCANKNIIEHPNNVLYQ